MEFVSNNAKPPPSYPWPDEDAVQIYGQPQTPGNDLPLGQVIRFNNVSQGEAKKEDSKVTISFKEPVPNRGKQKCQCVLSSFLCGCSLRTGCIVTAILYSLYAFLFGFFCLVFGINFVAPSSPDVREMYNFSPQGPCITALQGIFITVLFECCLAIFIVVFISVGLDRKSAGRLNVAKWLMAVDLCLKLMEGITIACQMYIFGLIFLFIFVVVPAYLIFVVHSYKAQLEIKKQDGFAPIPPLRTDSNIAFSTVN